MKNLKWLKSLRVWSIFKVQEMKISWTVHPFMKILKKAVFCISPSWRLKLKISQNIKTKLFLLFQVTWEEARNFCHQTGGRLASVEDEIFVPVLGYATTKNNIWLGGNFLNSTWSWADHEDIKDTDFFWSMT